MYVAGDRHGPWEGYALSGRLLEQGTYERGERCGPWLEAGESVTYTDCLE